MSAGTGTPGSGCRTVFIGAVEEGRRCLEGMLEWGEPFAGFVTLKEEWAQRTSGAVPFDDLARSHGIPLLKVGDLNHPSNVRRIRDLRPDLLLVIGWTRLLGREILEIPSRGCIGFHASLLPRYRGRAPVNWALIQGEKETGNSMIYLDPGVDTGDLVAQARIPISEEDDCRILYAKVSDAALGMLREHLPALKRGQAPRRPQAREGASVMPRRRPEDGIVDWGRPAVELHNWVRALTHPYPGAFTFRRGRKILLWKARPEPSPPGGEPGRIASARDDGMIVETGAGRLVVTRMQVEGEPEGEAGRVAAALGCGPGDRFVSPPDLIAASLQRPEDAA